MKEQDIHYASETSHGPFGGELVAVNQIEPDSALSPVLQETRVIPPTTVTAPIDSTLMYETGEANFSSSSVPVQAYLSPPTCPSQLESSASYPNHRQNKRTSDSLDALLLEIDSDERNLDGMAEENLHHLIKRIPES